MAAGHQCCQCAVVPQEGFWGPAGGEELLDLLDMPVLQAACLAAHTTAHGRPLCVYRDVLGYSQSVDVQPRECAGLQP